MVAADVALLCKALGDTNRLQIVQMLSDGEKCGCKLLEQFRFTQPTLSHHMKILCECGLVFLCEVFFMVAADVALLCKALGDTNRLQIVQMLSDGEKCGCKLLEQFRFTQPTLSHHMKILCECGLVTARKEGKWSHYSLNRETFEALQAFLAELGRNSETMEGCCQ